MSFRTDTQDVDAQLADIAEWIRKHDSTFLIPEPTIVIEGELEADTGHTHDGTGEDSTVIGGVAEAGSTVADASALGSFAGGDDAVASGIGSIALGKGAEASDEGAIAIGADNTGGILAAVGPAEAAGPGAIAIGIQTRASGGSVVIGEAANNSASGFGDEQVVIGWIAQGGNQDEVIAIGFQAAIGDIFVAGTTNTSAILIGETGSLGFFSNSSHSVAIGPEVQLDGAFSTAIGKNTLVDADSAIAVGGFSSAVGDYGIAIGESATAWDQDTIAVGQIAEARGLGGIAIGRFAILSNGGGSGQPGSVAIGEDAQVGDFSTSITDAVAIGNRARVLAGRNNIAIGAESIANSLGGSVAIGGWPGTNDPLFVGTFGANALGENSIAIGPGAIALDDISNSDATIAIGYDAEAGSHSGIAIGAGAFAVGDASSGGWAIAIGDNAQAGNSGDESIAIGRDAAAGARAFPATGDVAAIAIGSGSLADRASTTAIGHDSHAGHASATALGTLATTTLANQLMLGTTAEHVKHPGGSHYRTNPKSASYTATIQDFYIPSTGGAGGITITLPAATGTGQLLLIKKIDSGAGAVTVDRAGTDTIDGETSFSLDTQYDLLFIQDGASGRWDIIHVQAPEGGGGGGAGGAYAETIGNGVDTSFTITHDLGTQDVVVEVYEAASPFDTVIADIAHTTINSVTVSFAAAPSSNEYRVVVLSGGSTGGDSNLAITQIDDTDSPYTAALADEFIEADATNGAITINLPTAVGNDGKRYWIKKIDSSANAVTVDGDGAETIDDAATFILNSQYDTLAIVSNGAEWWVL